MGKLRLREAKDRSKFKSKKGAPASNEDTCQLPHPLCCSFPAAPRFPSPGRATTLTQLQGSASQPRSARFPIPPPPQPFKCFHCWVNSADAFRSQPIKLAPLCSQKKIIMFSLALDNVLPPRSQHTGQLLLPSPHLGRPRDLCSPRLTSKLLGWRLVRVQRGREQVEGTALLQPGEDFYPPAVHTGVEGVGPREDPRIIVILVTIYGERAPG